MKAEAKRGRGRPPKLGPHVSQYPKMATYMEPVLKAQLHAAARIMGKPAWLIINEAVAAYIHQLPKADRDALDLLADRVTARQKERLTA